MYACFVLFPGLYDTGLESLCKLLPLLPLAWLKLKCTFCRVSHLQTKQGKNWGRTAATAHVEGILHQPRKTNIGGSLNSETSELASFLNSWICNLQCKSGVAHLSHSLYTPYLIGYSKYGVKEKDAILQLVMHLYFARLEKHVFCDL